MLPTRRRYDDLPIVVAPPHVHIPSSALIGLIREQFAARRERRFHVIEGTPDKRLRVAAASGNSPDVAASVGSELDDGEERSVRGHRRGERVMLEGRQRRRFSAI